MGFVWIRAPKTLTVFGILFNGFTRLISGLLPVFTPRSFIYAEAFFVRRDDPRGHPAFGQGQALSLHQL